MKYLVVEDEKVFDNVDDVIEYCIDDDYHSDDDYFEEWVNEGWNSIDICGTTYYAFDILRNADDGNYADCLSDFCQSMNESDADNAGYDLEHGNVGDEIYCQAYTIRILADDTENDEVADIEELRQFIEDKRCIDEQQLAAEKAQEDDFMKLFQVIA